MTPHARTPGWSERAEPFVTAGVLTLGEVHVVDRLAALAGESRPDVLLGLAFAVRAPRAGHAGVHLDTVGATLALDREGVEAPSLPGVGWHDLVAGCALVGPGAPFVAASGLLQSHRLADYESRLARALVARSGLLPGAVVSVARLQADLAENFPGAAPSDLQRLAGIVAVVCRTAVVTGGPGTGKTTTVARVLRLLYGQAAVQGVAPPRVALAAPTGKAAARLRESLALAAAPRADAASAWVASLESLTLHRLLGYNPAHPSRPNHNAVKQLPFDVVIVDEASMIDVAMMCKLVEAVPSDARLVLLGDRHQLASVEAGNVLGDLALAVADAGPVPEVSLPPTVASALAEVGGPEAVEGRVRVDAPRLASGMVSFSTAFRFEVEALREPIYALADASRDPAQQDVHLARALAALGSAGEGAVRRVDHEGAGLSPSLLAEVVSAYGEVMAPLRNRPGDPAAWSATLAAVDRIRVLCAHRAGPLGVVALNRAISAALRAAGDRDAWWVGRLIIVTENDYESGLWNGDVGVVGLSAGEPVAIFAGPAGPRAVPVAALPAHESAFAMTIHKSQGSQFAHAVVVLPTEITPLLTRELVYTGISRARSQLTVAGPVEVLAAAIERRVARASGLARKLRACEAAAVAPANGTPGG